MKRVRISCFLFALMFFATVSVGSALAIDSATPPDSYQGVLSQTADMQSLSIQASTATESYAVLLIQDLNPWMSTANQDLLYRDGVSYKKIKMSDAANENFNNYKKIIIASDQLTSFYDTYISIASKFDNYVLSGGMLEWHTSGFGWNDGDSSNITLPGGVKLTGSYYSSYNRINSPLSPLVAGVQSPFWGDFASHQYFGNFSNVSHLEIIATEGQTDTNRPTLVQYPYGKGCVVASTQTLEFGYSHSEPAGGILANMIPYYCPKNVSEGGLADDTDVAFVRVAVTIGPGEITTIEDGHAWIEITDLSMPGKRETWGTFGNKNPIGLYQNLELNNVSDASRSMFVTKQQLDNLRKVIDHYISKGETAWTLTRNCTIFATDGWNSVSGEKIDTKYSWDRYIKEPISNPTSVMYWIINNNGGTSDKTINQCNSPFCNSPCPAPAMFCGN